MCWPYIQERSANIHFNKNISTRTSRISVLDTKTDYNGTYQHEVVVMDTVKWDMNDRLMPHERMQCELV